MILVLGIGLNHGDNGVPRNEAAKVVDVTVGVVADDAAPQPDSVRRAQVVGKSLFVMDARHVGIAFLYFAEKTFFGGENGSYSVHVDRSAFEHHALAHGMRSNLLGAGGSGNEAPDFFVFPPVGILRPGVKAKLEGQALVFMWGRPFPAIRRLRALLWRQENAARIAQPDAVGGPAVKVNVAGEGVASFENVASLPRRGGVLHDQ